MAKKGIYPIGLLLLCLLLVACTTSELAPTVTSVVLQEETPPAETPPPLPVAPADEVVEEISPEFFAFVPVCVEAMVSSGVTEGDAQALCQCTAMESSALGVEPSTIAEFTEQVRQDPTYQTEDERIRQASSVCFERLTGGAEPDTP